MSDEVFKEAVKDTDIYKRWSVLSDKLRLTGDVCWSEEGLLEEVNEFQEELHFYIYSVKDTIAHLERTVDRWYNKYMDLEKRRNNVQEKNN